MDKSLTVFFFFLVLSGLMCVVWSLLLLQEASPVKGFFTGVGPRSLSSGIHTAIFFCLFEAICNKMANERTKQQQQLALANNGTSS